MKVNIHNQCSDFKLGQVGYFNNGVHLNKRPDEVDAGSMMSTVLTPFLSAFEGVLTYELEKGVKSTHIQLFVAWKSEGYENFHVSVQLIKHDEILLWHTTKIGMYYQRYTNQFSTYTGPTKDTWSLDDGTVLMTRLELDFTQRDGVLSITISEGVKDNHTKIPEQINSKM
jgi:hypothetical protein